MTKLTFLHKLGLLALLLVGFANRSTADGMNATPAKPLPRVLLIGDSIRGGYGEGVQQLLAGKAEILMNPGNAEYTGTGLKKIDEWLGEGKWDVIHFNLETFKGVQWADGYHSPADFNPGGKVDTDAWADAAVSAGIQE